MTSAPLQTPLHEWHQSHRGRMVEFAGWLMPVQYTSISEEHHATRNAVGLFDISHMGRLRVLGSHAARYLDRLVTRRVSDLRPGKIRYALMTNSDGGVLDDVLVYHIADGGSTYHQVVVNAGNRNKIVEWMAAHRAADDDVQVLDETLDTAMIAVQGPSAIAALGGKTPADLRGMGYYSGTLTTVCGRTCLLSRTGYTGEDGCELIVARSVAQEIWDVLMTEAERLGGRPVGLGARDTLRLEAAMPLYGHELTDTIDPLQAGLDFAVNLDGREFIGADAIRAVRSSSPRLVRIGLRLEGRRVPREHCVVLSQDRPIGEVTSGTFSPTFNVPIAMAYVPPEHAALGGVLQVDIRGRRESATVVKLPFYSRSSGVGGT